MAPLPQGMPPLHELTTAHSAGFSVFPQVGDLLEGLELLWLIRCPILKGCDRLLPFPVPRFASQFTVKGHSFFLV